MIKQSVINTFNRIGFKDWKKWDNTQKKVIAENRFGGGSCETTPLIAHLIKVVYNLSNQYELGTCTVNISDFDRIRYFILDQDSNAYNVCID